MKYLRDRCLEAQMSTEEKANFLTKHCNLFVHGASKWLDMDEVFACRVEGLSIEDYRNEICYASVDRALVLDITSVCLLFPTPDGGIALFWKNIISKQGYEKASEQLRSVYSKAQSEGDLIISETEIVSDDDAINLIKDAVGELSHVETIGYDPWHMREVCNKLTDQGYPVVAVSQGTGNISEPAKKLEALIKNKQIKYDSRMFEFAASCAVIGVTKMNNVAIYREKPKNEKIDPLIAAIIALSCATLMEPNDNIYEQRGLLML
jgi:phage terminase large subunit-like protein